MKDSIHVLFSAGDVSLSWTVLTFSLVSLHVHFYSTLSHKKFHILVQTRDKTLICFFLHAQLSFVLQNLLTSVFFWDIRVSRISSNRAYYHYLLTTRIVFFHAIFTSVEDLFCIIFISNLLSIACEIFQNWVYNVNGWHSLYNLIHQPTGDTKKNIFNNNGHVYIYARRFVCTSCNSPRSSW